MVYGLILFLREGEVHSSFGAPHRPANGAVTPIQDLDLALSPFASFQGTFSTKTVPVTVP